MAGSMSRPGEELVDDVKIVVSVDFFGGEDTVLAADLENRDRDHQITRELKCAGLCE